MAGRPRSTEGACAPRRSRFTRRCPRVYWCPSMVATSILRASSLALSLALLALAGASARAQPTTTVAVDVRGLDERTYQKIDAVALEKQLVLRLVQEGFAVVSAAAKPVIVVRLVDAPRGLALVAERGDVRERRDVGVDGEPLPEL